MSEENKSLIARFFAEVLNGGDFDEVVHLIAAQYVEHAALPGQGAGPEGVKERLMMFRGGFPDFQYHLEDLIAERDKVVSRWKMEGTHQGEFMGMAPSGKKVSVSGIDIYRIAGGRIAEHWHEMDTLGMMRELGAIPSPQRPEESGST